MMQFQLKSKQRFMCVYLYGTWGVNLDNFEEEIEIKGLALTDMKTCHKCNGDENNVVLQNKQKYQWNQSPDIEYNIW